MQIIINLIKNLKGKKEIAKKWGKKIKNSLYTRCQLAECRGVGGVAPELSGTHRGVAEEGPIWQRKGQDRVWAREREREKESDRVLDRAREREREREGMKFLDRYSSVLSIFRTRIIDGFKKTVCDFLITDGLI